MELNLSFKHLTDSDLNTLSYESEWNSIEVLDVSYNQLTSLPPLPIHLRILKCSHNQLISLLPINFNLPETLEEIYCEYNQLTSLPPLPSSVFVIVCNDNYLTEIPLSNLNSNVPVMRLENNPVSESLYRIDSFDSFDSFNPFESNGLNGSIRFSNPLNLKISSRGVTSLTTTEERVPILTLKKGTVLFHTFETLQDLEGMFIGFPSGDGEYLLNPNQQVFFLLHPFNIQYGFKTLILTLQNDVEVFMGLTDQTQYDLDDPIPFNPLDLTLMKSSIWNKTSILSKLYVSGDENDCDYRYPCRTQEVIQKESQVMGYIAHDLDANGNPGFWHGETKDFFEYYPYVSYYHGLSIQHENDMIVKRVITDRPEVVLYPRKIRSTFYYPTPSYEFETQENYIFTYLRDHEEEFNYKMIDIVENNVDYHNVVSAMNSLIDRGMYRSSEGLWRFDL